MRVPRMLPILFILLLATPISARTRLESIEEFLDDTRVSVEGFTESIGGEVTTSATYRGLKVSAEIRYSVNNSLDIQYFLQRSQNQDGGFGETPDKNSTWTATVNAVKSLQLLGFTPLQLSTWGMFEFLNKTAVSDLYKEVAVGNQTALEMLSLNLALISQWDDYITASLLSGGVPLMDRELLVQQLQNFQLDNGSYASFELGARSILLLTSLGELPRDVKLAADFINTFQTVNGAFAAGLNLPETLYATSLAVRALDSLGGNGSIFHPDEIVRFVLKHQLSNSGFAETNQSAATLQSTLDAVQILNTLGKYDELLFPEVLQTVGFVSYPLFGLLALPILWRRKQ